MVKFTNLKTAPQSRRPDGLARFRDIVCLVCGTLALLFATGCGSRERPVDQANRDGILLLGNGTEPENLDPHTVTGVPEIQILQALLEGLIAPSRTDDAPLEPGVAKSWELSDDGLTYTFQLREDARWSNGDPVTAHDFVYSVRRVLTPELGNEYVEDFYCLHHAQAFYEGAITDFSEVGVTAVDDHTLQYRLHTPLTIFLQRVRHNAWMPVHRPTIEKHGGIAARATRWTRPENFVGNGPFQLSAWETNQRIETVRNPHYWDAENVGLKGITFFPIEDANAEERAFNAGQLHITNAVPLPRIPWYRENRPEVIRLDPYLGTYFYLLNVTRPGLDDPRVRRALALAVDREAIVERITRGGERPAGTYVPDLLAGYPSPEGFAYDPEQARQLLADAGYPGGEGFPTFQLLFNTAENHRIIAEAVQQMWKTKLGINVVLTNQEWKVYLNTQSNLNYDISRRGWIANTPHPSSFLENFRSYDANNNCGYANPAFDRLVEEAIKAQDPGRAHELYRQAEIILLEDAPLIPLYFYTNPFLIRPEVRNWGPKLNGLYLYKQVRLEPTIDE